MSTCSKTFMISQISKFISSVHPTIDLWYWSDRSLNQYFFALLAVYTFLRPFSLRLKTFSLFPEAPSCTSHSDILFRSAIKMAFLARRIKAEERFSDCRSRLITNNMWSLVLIIQSSLFWDITQCSPLKVN
jgi:hypothetical protein